MIGRLDVIEDVVEVDLGEVATPVGHGPLLEVAQRLQPEVEHPLRLVLDAGNLFDHIRRKAALGLEYVLDFVVPAQGVTAQINANVSHVSGSFRAASEIQNFHYRHSNK